LLGMENATEKYHPQLDPRARDHVWRCFPRLGARRWMRFWDGDCPSRWHEYGQLRLGRPGRPETILKHHLGSVFGEGHCSLSFGTRDVRMASQDRWSLCQLAGLRMSPISELHDICFAIRKALTEGSEMPPRGGRHNVDAPRAGAGFPRRPVKNHLPSSERTAPSIAVLLPYLGRGGCLIEHHNLAVLPAISMLPYWAVSPAKFRKRGRAPRARRFP